MTYPKLVAQRVARLALELGVTEAQVVDRRADGGSRRLYLVRMWHGGFQAVVRVANYQDVAASRAACDASTWHGETMLADLFRDSPHRVAGTVAAATEAVPAIAEWAGADAGDARLLKEKHEAMASRGGETFPRHAGRIANDLALAILKNPADADGLLRKARGQSSVLQVSDIDEPATERVVKMEGVDGALALGVSGRFGEKLVMACVDAVVEEFRSSRLDAIDPEGLRALVWERLHALPPGFRVRSGEIVALLMGGSPPPRRWFTGIAALVRVCGVRNRAHLAALAWAFADGQHEWIGELCPWDIATAAQFGLQDDEFAMRSSLLEPWRDNAEVVAAVSRETAGGEVRVPFAEALRALR